jgi:AAA family ATP:ADP antiporter
LILLLNVFLVLAAYYLIKPVREGWLAISAIEGLSRIEVKAYSSFGHSFLLLFLLPMYSWLAGRVTRAVLITCSSLFFMAHLVGFWALQPGFLIGQNPYMGVAFYMWVGIFSVAVVAQFWSFAADLYSDERGKRLFPLIAIGASAGAATGAWLTERLIKTGMVETFDLLLLAIAPLGVALLLSWFADRRGTGVGREGSAHKRGPRPAAPDQVGAFEVVFKHRYVLAAALLGLLINWVNTNGENILYGFVQQTIQGQVQQAGLTDADAVATFVKKGTTAFYGNLYLWVNGCGLLLQALVVSRLLKYGGIAAVLFLTPVISLLSYSMMAIFPALVVIRWMKIAENSANYSVNNTARHVLWLPTSPTQTYKGKAAADTFFVRTGDGLAALTVLVGTRMFGVSLKMLLLFNVTLVLAWGLVAAFIVRENRRLLAANPPGEGGAGAVGPTERRGAIAAGPQPGRVLP